MPSEPIRQPVPDRLRRPPSLLPSAEAEFLQALSHLIFDYTVHVRALLAPLVEIADPASVATFASKFTSLTASEDLGDLVSGLFSDVVRFANLFRTDSPAPASQTTPEPSSPRAPGTPARSGSQHGPPEPRSFLDALVNNIPGSSVRLHPHLPRLVAGQPPPPEPVQPKTYPLTRRGNYSLQRAVLSVCGHEPKAFA